MATAETLTNPLNKSSNSINGSDKELANDVILGCQDTMSLVFCGDEGNREIVPEYDMEGETVVGNSMINTQVPSLNEVDKTVAKVPVIAKPKVSEKWTSSDSAPGDLQDNEKTSETTLKPCKFSNILDSGSEDERSDLSFNWKQLNHGISENPGFYSSDKPKDVEKSSASGGRILVIDSDTDDENEDHEIQSLKSNESVDQINSSSSRRQGNRDKASIKSDCKLVTSKISALVDTDSEDDSSFIHKTSASWSKEEPMTQPTKLKEKWNDGKKRTRSIRATKEIAMREIKSESQRMLRESGLSLPYHRPRQRTLQEFMSRRKKLQILATAPTTAAKVKLSVEIVGKVLAAKEKEVEHFFKSDSDSDGDVQCNLAIPTLDIKDNKSTGAIKQIMENEEEVCRINDKGAQQEDKRNGVSRNLFASKNEFPEDGCPPLFREQDNEALATNSNNSVETLAGLGQELRFNIESSKLLSTEINKRKHAGCTSISENQTTSHIDRTEAIEDDSEEFQLRLSEDQYTLMNNQRSPESEKVLKIDSHQSESITGKWPVDEEKAIKVNANRKADAEVFEVDRNLADCSGDTKVNNKPIGHVYGLPLPEFENDLPTRRKNKKILSDIMKIVPKLQGSPNMLIDLTSHKVGVSSLMQRFIKHSVVKKPVKSVQDIEITFAKQTATGATVVTEILPYQIPFNERNDDPKLSKPGAKLTRLKEELQQKMSVHRNKEWEQKEQETKASMTDDPECEMEEEDEGEEIELSSSGESEPDEDDMPMKKVGNKKKYQSPFVDLDAEVSGEESEDEEEEDDEVSGEESREDKEGNVTDVQDEQDNGDISENGEEDEPIQEDQVRKLKRITKGFQDEDSDDDDPVSTAINTTPSNGRHFSRTRTDVDIFASDNNSNDDWLSNADDLPGSQRRVDEKRQLCGTPLVANNSLSIISPLTQLTALNTGSKSLSADSSFTQGPSEIVASLLADETPIEKNCPRVCDPDKLERLQKKLFHDTKDLPNDDLVDLCSNKFSDTVCDNSGLDKIMHMSNKTQVSDAELFELCSGTFATQRNEDERLESVKDHNEQIGTCKVESSKISPCNSPSFHKQIQKLNENSEKLKIIFSSDDESSENNLVSGSAKKRNFKRKPKILQLSDDEDESENEDDGKSGFDSDEQFVDYDSEENEIPSTKKNIVQAAAGFVDEEAELSESDWGSADEDEKDLDKFEMEEGDLENIDEEEVRKQAGKLHMRQVLDQDQREVRLLQEMLLEDGELHSDGAARQRKFKWKNIDQLGDNDQDQLCDPEEGVTIDPIDVESELEWRKQRLEREQFLQRQKADEASADIEIETQNSQLFQLGMKALKKNKCSKSTTMDTSTIIAVSSEVSAKRHTIVDLFANPGSGKKTLQSAIHRGSFLARGEESLARLSRITKQNSSNQAITKPKNSRNFVFAHLSPAINLPVEDEPVSSQEKDITKNDKSRKRKPAFSMTPLASKNSKKKREQIDGHKLFS